MTLANFSRSGVAARPRGATLSPATARALFVSIVAVALAAGFLATDGEATARAVSGAGADLTRLLRAMAALKALMAVGALAAVLWRLGVSVGGVGLAAYVLAGAAMAAGPGLIWSMAHVGWGALLLHGGLLMSILLLWRDPAVGARLADIIAARRSGHA